MNRLATYTVLAGTKLLVTIRWSYDFCAWEQINHICAGHSLRQMLPEAVAAHTLETFRCQPDFQIMEIVCAWCPHPRAVRDTWDGAQGISHGICHCCLAEITTGHEGLIEHVEKFTAQRNEKTKVTL